MAYRAPDARRDKASEITHWWAGLKKHSAWLHWMISGAARLDLLIWQGQVGFLMIYCSTWVSGHQLPGDNLFGKQHEGCQWAGDSIICHAQPKTGTWREKKWRKVLFKWRTVCSFSSFSLSPIKQPVGKRVWQLPHTWSGRTLKTVVPNWCRLRTLSLSWSRKQAAGHVIMPAT